MQEDFRSPTTSAFASHMGHCKATDNNLEKMSRGGGLQGCTLGDGNSHHHCGPTESVLDQASPYYLSP